MDRGRARAVPSAPPAQALPIVLAYLSGDLPSLLAAACVSHDWREALSGMPEVWQAVHFPKQIASKVTDRGLRWILRQSGERGLTSLDLGGCSQLTDQVVPYILNALKRVPEKVSLKGCGRMTWRGAWGILQYLQNRYEQEVGRGEGRGGANELERGRRRLQSVRLSGISLEGCDPAVLMRLTSLPVVGGLLDWMALCDRCLSSHLLEKCEWCGVRGCREPNLELDMVECVRCQKFGCVDHFQDLNFAHCNCAICDECLDEHPDRATPCYKCDVLLCPVCDAGARNYVRECTGPCLPPNIVCDSCRLDECICTCNNDDMTVEELRRHEYPVLCEECVRTQERVFSAEERQFGQEPATRYCGACGLLRKCHPDLGTDDDSEDNFSDDPPDSHDTEALGDSDDYDSWFDELKPRKKRGEECSSDEETDSEGAVDGAQGAGENGEEGDEDVSYDDEEDAGDDDEDEDDVDDDDNEDDDDDDDEDDDDEGDW
ncbi:hypothetical protein KFL_004510010 [Klebsormidium nitens]|uniref:F-box domain-containing protein n=1 Tax=Klebsormidium nitens TaxID=105231 RepID=A0A1Y1ICI1_KLENI|nr:hypothetical protein KFL_004510010 [Klebsormidium nitens]|eukprot:GAQ88674.1 hypothetical protein KFL_004510010 [Klebsormidium nitens]